MALSQGRGALAQSGDSIILKSGATDQVTVVAGANATASVLTLPAPLTDTLVSRTSTDTLTGKSIDATTNTLTNIANSAIKSDAAIAYSKLAALTSANILVGSAGNVATVTAVTGDISISNAGVTAISSGVIVDADVSGSAAIAFSKLAALTDGNILVGSVGNVATSVAVTGDVVISNAGVTAISSGAIVNADVNGSAAIALTKLAAATASRALVSDASGFIVPATTTSTEIGYVNGVTSAIQTQLNTKITTSSSDVLTNKSIDADTNTITNIENADIKAAAAIAVNKLAALTVSRAVVSDGSGFLAASAATATEVGYLSGVTSSIQTQLNSAGVNPMTTQGDIIFGGASGVMTRLAAGATGTVLKGGTSPSWATIVNADVDASAAIAFSKLATLSSANILVGSAGNVATAVAVTGDVTISNAGVTAIGSGVIVNADVSGSAAIAGSKLVAAASGVIGVVTATTQTFTGNKTFEDVVTASRFITGGETPTETSRYIAPVGTNYPGWTSVAGTNSTRIHMSFENSIQGTPRVGSISTNTATTSYTTSSDRRLKKNIKALSGAWSLIDQMQPKQFEWVSSSTPAFGFIAQELAEVFPDAVLVGDDELYPNGSPKNPWGVDYSKLTPLLIAAIQELRQEVIELRAKVKG